MSGIAIELLRLCMASDGRVKAQFQDNSILILSPNGKTFASIDPDGNAMSQLSDCAISRHLVALAVAVEFRSMHVSNPSFCSKLRTPRDESLVLGFCMTDLYWPMSLEEAEAKGLIHHGEDGKVTISTEDGCGQIVLHQNRRRFGISYPLLVRDIPLEGAWEYIWQTQVFSLLSFPQRWDPVVSLLLKAAKELDQMERNVERVAGPADTTEASVSEEWERREAAFSASPSGRRTELPQALEGGYGSPLGSCAEDFCSTEGWWSEPTLTLMPPKDLILMEWTPQATYQFHPTSEPYEVEAWIHEDESCLSTVRQGRFVAHHRPLSRDQRAQGATEEQLYAADSVPESSWSSATEGGRYALAPIASHAIKFRQQMAAQLSKASSLASIISGLALHHHHPNSLIARPHGPHIMHPHSTNQGLGQGLGQLGGDDARLDPEWAFAVSSDVILEEEVVPHQGTFTAYEDGRLRCFFEDRTILHMDPTMTYCKMLMPDGQRLIVTVENAVGVEAYVEAATSFATWAFKPQEEREREAKERAMAEAEAAASVRMAQILEWTAAKPSAAATSTSTRPPPLTPGLESNSHLHGASALGVKPNSSPPASGFTSDDIEAMLKRNRELVEKLLL